MKHPPRRTQALAALLFCAGLALVFFFDILGPGKTLFGSDANIGHMAYTKAELPGSFLGRWVENGLVGNPSYMPLKISSFLLLFMPVGLYMSVLIPLELVLGSWCLMLFLRGRGLGWAPAAFGAVAAFWLGSNFTLVYAGHIGKFGVLCFSAVALWLIDLAARRGSMGLAVLAGAAVGQTFMEQADVAFLFGLFLAAYALHACIREYGADWRKILRLLVPTGAVAFLFAFGPLVTGYLQNVRSAGVMEEASDAEAKWQFVTQWSWPPGESLDLVAPGYMGWRSNDPRGPYWGKLGRTEGWDETRNGYMNFRLESEYLSLLPFLLAAAAIGFGLRGRRRPEMTFWIVAAAVSLLLSFGKFSPLYRLAYHLPMISYVRAPVKFLQVFQLALAILAALGLDGYLRRPGDDDAGKNPVSAPSALRWVLAGITALLALASLGTAFAAETKMQSLVAFGWPETTARILVANRAAGLRHAVVIGLLGTGFAFAMQSARVGAWRKWLPHALVIVLVVDAYLLSRHYVKPAETRPIADNTLARTLARAQDHGRCFALDQDPLYNNLLTVDFPYHGLEFVNITQMPRMAAENQQFLEVFGRNAVPLWQLAAVQNLLMTDATWQGVSANPALRAQLTPTHRFRLQPRKNGEVIEAHALPLDAPGGHLVVKSALPAARYALFTDWAAVPAADALAAMQQPDFRPMQRVVVSGELPDFMTAATNAPSGTQPVEVLSHTARRRHLKAVADAPVLLRISERYHPDWSAAVDGEPAPLLRCDYLFQAVCLPAGTHEVTLTYAPPRTPWLLQLAGYAAAATVVLLSGAQPRRTKASSGDQRE